jgi:hypothetical protein
MGAMNEFVDARGRADLLRAFHVAALRARAACRRTVSGVVPSAGLYFEICAGGIAGESEWPAQ